MVRTTDRTVPTTAPTKVAQLLGRPACLAQKGVASVVVDDDDRVASAAINRVNRVRSTAGLVINRGNRVRSTAGRRNQERNKRGTQVERSHPVKPPSMTVGAIRAPIKRPLKGP